MVANLAGRFWAILLLPLSLLPFVLVVPGIVRHERNLLRDYVDRGPLPLPAGVALDRPYPRLAPAANAVPVLAYHGIGPMRDGYTVSQRAFAQQMAMLARAGFRTISPEQYVRFLDGDRRGLPARPILLTFDDGRLDSYRGADKILAYHGFRATIFVITGPVDDKNQFYLRWSELRRMEASGRWDVQEHADQGHQLARYDAHGHSGPWYANRLYA